MILEDKSVLFNEHALLLLGEDKSLVLAQGVLAVDQVLTDHVVCEALVGRRAVADLRSIASIAPPLTELEERWKQRAVSADFFRAPERH